MGNKFIIYDISIQWDSMQLLKRKGKLSALICKGARDTLLNRLENGRIIRIIDSPLRHLCIHIYMFVNSCITKRPGCGSF